jgi:TolB-like protein/DNA-binding winged helix-turn-helix (wHTH) protein/Flp pilus assembly protein TadD
MNDRVQKAGLLRFGTFELDYASGELRRGGALIKLQSQHFQLLALLAERAGQVVSRDEIRRALWDNETFVDFDRSINVSVNQIRGALGDDPQSPRYIETLPRKGYRFIAPVTEAGDDRAEVEPAADPGLISRPAPARRWWLLSAGALVVLVALAMKVGVSRQPGTKPIESLAVLPLENLSHDPEQDYFADGMTEELITALAKVSALRVISRTSVMQYKGTKKPIPQIARELNVDAVLEGTVTQDQGRVRITTQLIRAAPEQHLWAEKYEGSLSEVLTVQDEVAKAVVREIQIKVTPRERTLLAKRSTQNAEAYQLYLKGRYYWNRRTEQSLKRAIEYFHQAIDMDPGYSLAYAGLTDCYAIYATYRVESPQVAGPKAKAAATRALEIDDTLANAHASFGMIKMQYDWDWAGAERELRRSIELDPNYATAHQWLSNCLAATGRTEQAIASCGRAQQLDPLSMIINGDLGFFLFVARRYDEAIEQVRTALEIDPSFAQGHWSLGLPYEQKAMYQKASFEFQKVFELSGTTPRTLGCLGHAYGLSGDRQRALQTLADLRELSKRHYVSASDFAMIYLGLGDKEHALQWLEKGLEDRPWGMVFMRVDPRFDGLRADPRFANLLLRMKL